MRQQQIFNEEATLVVYTGILPVRVAEVGGCVGDRCDDPVCAHGGPCQQQQLAIWTKWTAAANKAAVILPFAC